MILNVTYHKKDQPHYSEKKTIDNQLVLGKKIGSKIIFEEKTLYITGGSTISGSPLRKKYVKDFINPKNGKKEYANIINKKTVVIDGVIKL